MGDTFFENLFYKQEKQFEKINDLSKAFAVTKSASVESSPPEIPITADLQCVCSSRFFSPFA